MRARGERKLKYEKPSPHRFIGTAAAAMGMIGGLAKLGGGLAQRGGIRSRRDAANTAYDQQRQNYMDFDFADPHADLTNTFTGLENPMEDLTINQQEAQFQRQQQQQGMATIMQGMQGAAGGSGIAGLAQAMALQSQKNAAQASASIGAQESKNKMAAAAQQATMQQQEAKFGHFLQENKAKAAVEVQERELGRVENLWEEAGANKIAANEAMQANMDAMMGGIGETIGGAIAYESEGGKFPWSKD